MLSRDKNKGVLLPLFSLPTADFDSAFAFGDILKNAGFDLWQILPVSPAGKGGSPYYSPSAFAGDIRYIGTERLFTEGYIKDKSLSKSQILRLAAMRISETSPDFLRFKEENEYWLSDYAFYTALGGKVPQSAAEQRKAKILYKDECAEISKKQFLFFAQLKELRDYLNSLGIRLIGDMPIYVSDESAEVTFKPSIFSLDKDENPKEIAGVPPDSFSKTGQLWGNPLYAWEENPDGCYEFFRERFKQAKRLYDIIRIDHFRGFADYYAIPAGSKTAENGVFKKGPGARFFKKLEKELGTLPVIAEDMGKETEALKKLVSETGYTGMRVFQFDYKKEIRENCAVYTGTHDNDTLLGWYSSLSASERKVLEKIIGKTDETNLLNNTLTYLYNSPARYVIVPAADFLHKKSDGRINTPATLGGNWLWKMTESEMSELKNL